MKKYKLYLFAALLGMMFTACEYEFIPADEIPDIPTDEPVSFGTDILPIFSSGSPQCIQCHKPGSQAPDLTEANAYQSLKGSKYIDEANPEQSYIITHVGPDSNSHTQRHLSAADVEYIRVWVEQGAENN
ncbi:hypothetical protein [Mangrovibacterium lignilyticum]|uniref:hypothetical protein n=1 Tax=Mangrovibacterium lignilyticum TaxID=2668052 RepID=UPI0013D2D03A|nr:hypothetical protein [Mangrovibacterium lignilyticum]